MGRQQVANIPAQKTRTLTRSPLSHIISPLFIEVSSVTFTRLHLHPNSRLPVAGVRNLHNAIATCVPLERQRGVKVHTEDRKLYENIRKRVRTLKRGIYVEAKIGAESGG